jgi:ATP-binding cassette, subfamily B, bacterial PglK
MLLCALQITITVFDIFAIVLLGLASNAGLRYVQDGTGNIPNGVLRILRLTEFGFEYQFAFLCFFIFLLFCLRTSFSIYVNKRIFLFLGDRGAIATNNYLALLFRSRPKYVLNKNSQELLYGVTTGVDNLVLNYLGCITLFISECFFLSAISVVVLAIEPLTGICAFIIFITSFLIIHKVTSRKGKEFSRALGKLQIDYNQKLLERIFIYRELILRDQANASSQDLRRKRHDSSILRARLGLLPVFSKYLFEFVLIVGSAIVSIAQLLVSDAVAAVSSLVMFLAAASRILPSLIRAQGSVLTIKQSEGAAAVAIEQLDELKEELNLRNQEYEETEVSDFVPSIRIEKLNFAYSEESNFSMADISLDIKPGSFVAIVGESGSGKTTLVDLILGMNDPNSGTVQISGTSPLEAARKWPGKIAYVPQSIVILDASVYENITLDFSSTGSKNEVLKALELSRLLDDVLALPHSIDETVGERGFKLSGGQRQRLGIARALFTQPNLIVFDEATSALDPMTEKAVTDAIYRRMNGVTLIVIAHRLSTVRNADLVVLLDKGRLIAQGTFEEVRKLAPSFDQQAKLVNL